MSPWSFPNRVKIIFNWRPHQTGNPASHQAEKGTPVHSNTQTRLDYFKTGRSPSG
jgi:hypothetical protein